MKKKAIFCWSGGKDSSYALHQIMQEDEFEVVCLMTTLNKTFKRISMHGVREELLNLQAESIGLPLLKMWVSEGTNDEYEKNMERVLLAEKAKGVTHVIFGDIFLEDLREYRDNNLKKVDLTGVYPLWKKNTKALSKAFIKEGFKTLICCVNDPKLTKDYVGKVYDQDFLASLPENVDPCGEYGEFHSYAFDGPIFKTPISIETGEKIYRPISVENTATKGFWFVDIVIS